MSNIPREDIIICFGSNRFPLPWNERSKVVASCRNLIDLFLGGSRVLEDALQVPFKVAAEIQTSFGSFVCCDGEQFERTVVQLLPDASQPVSCEAIVLCAASAPASSSSATAVLGEGVKKMRVGELHVLVEGSLRVLDTNSVLLGRCAFDKARLPTPTELEEGIEALLPSTASGNTFSIGWRIEVDNSWMTTPSPLSSSSKVLPIDGIADVKALSNDVRLYGIHSVALVITSAQQQQQQRSLPPQSSATITPQPAALKATAHQILKGASPGGRPLSSGPSRGAVATTTTACRPGSATAASSSTVAVVANGRSITPRKSQRPNKSQRPGGQEEDDIYAEDTDIDYVVISYILNPPEIFVVGYLGDENLNALCQAILEHCVTSVRATMMRTTSPLAFVRSPRNVGVFPVNILSLTKCYFDEAQEMMLSTVILDAMDGVGSFRYVPLDCLSDRVGQSIAGQQRDRSKMMLNMNTARVTNSLAKNGETPAKRSAEFFFIPRL